MNNQSVPFFSWQEDEERMRSRAPSPRDCDSALGANSERRILESRICNEDMPYKPFIEGSGTSGVSSWLRQSMRRVRHFNLEDFTRIRSAPPDSLRSRVESEESETTVSQNVVNNRVTTGNDVQQLSRPGNNSRSQRQIPRTRPTSVPARPASEVTVTQQQQQQQQTQQQQQQPPDNETPSSSPTNETQDNLGYESDSTDRQPLPRG